VPYSHFLPRGALDGGTRGLRPDRRWYSFVSGLTYGLLEGLAVDTALAFGIAHGALAMTTPGDTSMATLGEVRRLAAGRSARVIR
jgi:hypothetical protein